MSSDRQNAPSDAPPLSHRIPEEPSHADRNRTSSSFTAVNGRSSPSKLANGPLSPTTKHLQHHAGHRESEAPKLNSIQVPSSHVPSASASLTTSPSVVESITTTTAAARNETPNSPHTAANSPPRKRSYEDYDGPERELKRHAPLPEPPVNPNTNANESQGAHRTYAPTHDQTGAHSGPPPLKTEAQRKRPLSSEHDPLAQPPKGYYSRQDDSDQQMSDPMPRDSEEANDRPHFASPDSEEPPRHHFSGEYTRTSGVQVDPDRNKRRKRVFSNRTKTGCMTCRKRKKKCDEMHPECNNCLRGGFVCEGYTVRNAWGTNAPKQQNTKAPIALQSKPVYPGSPHHSNRGYSEAHEYGTVPPKPELPRIDDHRDMSRISPSGDSRAAYSAPLHAPPPYAQGHGGPPPSSHQHSPHQRYDRPLHPHDNAHEPPETSNPYPSGPMVPAPGHGQQIPHHAHTSSMGRTSGVQHASIAAPQDPGSAGGIGRRSSARGEMSEREKMLRGEYYLPYTQALVADREQCAAAVWRFNNSTNPAMGIPPEERMRFFRQIVELRPTHDASAPPPGPHEPPPDPQYTPSGQVGPGVVVEAPFHCDYGYNITIGADCIIGPDCRISDTCSVTIGNNVVFSPGVKLVCATYAIDPRERKRGKGRALGRNIIIEDDAWIGSNVTVLPGVKVGRCSTVGAGSLLHKDVPPFTVVAGNPPKVVRGIYDESRP